MPEQPVEGNFRPVDYLERMTRALEGINDTLEGIDENLEVISDVFATLDTVAANYKDANRTSLAGILAAYKRVVREEEAAEAEEPEDNSDSA